MTDNNFSKIEYKNITKNNYLISTFVNLYNKQFFFFEKFMIE